MPATQTSAFTASPEDAGLRLDVFLVRQLPGVSRARVQELISQKRVQVEGDVAKASLKLRGGESITILGPAERAPLRAVAEDIPLDIVYEDDALAVINKPAGMMVHAGAGRVEDARNQGTLVNALLHRFGSLSATGGALRPGIVHRLDKDTSGLIVVAKDDAVHQNLAHQFSHRQVKKTYVALVHGWMKRDSGIIESAISRDRVRRRRMTTRRSGGRTALSEYRVLERIESALGRFSLVEVRIATGRTHQIRVHLSSLGHPVVGDSLYGAPRHLTTRDSKTSVPTLPRNFLHAAALEFTHPQTHTTIAFSTALPDGLNNFLSTLRHQK